MLLPIGHPQGGRAPTRGAPTDCLLSAPTRGAPTASLGVLPWTPTRGAPTVVFSRRFALGSALGKGTHKGCPYRLSSLGVLPWGGHPQGVPLPIVFSRRFALGRAPTRGAPTDCLLSAFGPGPHKGCPYRLSSLGVWPWEGHPQGVPLPIVFSRRLALGRAPTRGAPTDCLLSAFGPGKGTHKGCPYRRLALGRAPTRGAPTDCLLSAFALGRAPTRGAPTDCLLSAFGPGKGTHKGCPYRLSSLGVRPWEGHPQGVPLPIVFSRRSALGRAPQGVPLRAPTRGAPTDCLLSAFGGTQGRPCPDCLLSAFGPGKGTHKGCPYRLSSLRRFGPGEKGAHKGRPYPIQAASRGFF